MLNPGQLFAFHSFKYGVDDLTLFIVEGLPGLLVVDFDLSVNDSINIIP